MRRFSALTRVLQKQSLHSELEFLQQSPILSQINAAAAPSPSKSPLTPSNPAAGENFTIKSTTKGIKHLATAVGQRRFGDIERIFSAMPQLTKRPAAMRLLIKAYCEQQDFVSARAVLYACLDRVGDTGLQRYIAHLTYNARNPRMIEDAFNRACAYHQSNKTAISAPVVASVLCGLRFLDDRAAFDRCWNRTASQFWEPSLKAYTLAAKALDCMLNENWDQAARFWRIAVGMNSFKDVQPGLVWYMACRYFLVEAPNVEAVDKVLKLMQSMDFPVTPKITALVLRHFSTMYFSKSPIYWLEHAASRGWTMNSLCVEVVVHNFARRFPASKTENIAHKIQERVTSKLAPLGLLHYRRHALGEGERYSHFLRTVLGGSNTQTPEAVLNELQSFSKRGVRLSYDYFTAAFKYIAECNSTENTHQLMSMLVSMFKQHGYSVHSASTDLAMVELQCRSIYRSRGELLEARQLCKQFIGEYLVQYPLISLDLPKRTRVALLTVNYGGDFELGIAIADSLRAEQSMDGSATGFAASNHDCVSLQIMLRCKRLLGQPLTPFLRALVADNSGIYFDRKFRKAARSLLQESNEELDVLEEIDRSNERLEAESLKLVDEAVDYFASTLK